MDTASQRRAKQAHDDTQTLRSYTDARLPERTAVRGLKPKTVSEYQRYRDRLIHLTLGELRLKDVTSATVCACIGTRAASESQAHRAYRGAGNAGRPGTSSGGDAATASADDRAGGLVRAALR